jgi:ABC-type transport system involved in multi-copper enzyme maturation permease subunit
MNALTICINTFRESVRDRIFYVLLVFALIVIACSKAVAWISMEEGTIPAKVMQDLGLAAIAFFSVIISIYVGTGLLYKETDKRTIYTILSKPVHTYEFILGKYFGLLLTLLINVAVMGAVFLAYLYGWVRVANVGLVEAILLIYMEVVVVTAMAILFSTMASPILSAIFTFCMYVLGHYMWYVSELAGYVKFRAAKVACYAAQFILPNLYFFDVKTDAVHERLIPAGDVILAVVYGVIYSAILLIVSVKVFERKNF